VETPSRRSLGMRGRPSARAWPGSPGASPSEWSSQSAGILPRRRSLRSRRRGASFFARKGLCPLRPRGAVPRGRLRSGVEPAPAPGLASPRSRRGFVIRTPPGSPSWPTCWRRPARPTPTCWDTYGGRGRRVVPRGLQGIDLPEEVAQFGLAERAGRGPPKLDQQVGEFLHPAAGGLPPAGGRAAFGVPAGRRAEHPVKRSPGRCVRIHGTFSSGGVASSPVHSTATPAADGTDSGAGGVRARPFGSRQAEQ
jgi:hypothetical protein